MTLRDLNKMVQAREEYQQYNEAPLRTIMVLIRWVGAVIFNSKVRSSHQKDPERLFPLYFEKNPRRVATKEETMDSLSKVKW